MFYVDSLPVVIGEKSVGALLEKFRKLSAERFDDGIKGKVRAELVDPAWVADLCESWLDLHKRAEPEGLVSLTSTRTNGVWRYRITTMIRGSEFTRDICLDENSALDHLLNIVKRLLDLISMARHYDKLEKVQQILSLTKKLELDRVVEGQTPSPCSMTADLTKDPFFRWLDPAKGARSKPFGPEVEAAPIVGAEGTVYDDLEFKKGKPLTATEVLQRQEAVRDAGKAIETLAQLDREDECQS